MAVKTKDEIISMFSIRFSGESASDDDISFLEDITDTLNAMEENAKANTEWKTKYKENDEAWRKRYTERFLGKPVNELEETFPADPEEIQDKPLKFEDLFTKE